MGKIFNVEAYTKLENASKKLAELADVYTKLYEQLLQEANTMGTAWEGEDNLAFVDQINGFTEELQQMAKKLQLASEIIDNEKRNYQVHQDNTIGVAKKLPN